jgi:hypothetical protein
MMDFIEGVESFPWETEDQKEGFLAYIQFARGFGKEPVSPFEHLVLCFLIQKSHESAEYWRDTLAGRVDALRREIVDLRDQMDRVTSENESLRVAMESQLVALQTLNKLHTK